MQICCSGSCRAKDDWVLLFLDLMRDSETQEFGGGTHTSPPFSNTFQFCQQPLESDLTTMEYSLAECEMFVLTRFYSHKTCVGRIFKKCVAFDNDNPFEQLGHMLYFVLLKHE